MVKPRTMFLKMHTDEGIVGYGEPILEGHAHIVAAAIREFEGYLLGKIRGRFRIIGRSCIKGVFTEVGLS